MHCGLAVLYQNLCNIQYLTVTSLISSTAPQAKLKNIDSLKISLTPLMYHDGFYEWDELDEKIYREVFNDFRKSYRTILKNTGAYSKKILHWLRTCDQFGQIIVKSFSD